MQKNSVLIKNFTSQTLLQASNYIFPLITLPYVLRVLGPENFGIMNFAGAFAAYFIILINFSFHLSAPRIISINRENPYIIADIYSTVMTIRLLLSLLSAIIYFALISTVSLFTVNSGVFAVSFLLVIGQLFTLDWFFQGIEKIHYTTLFVISARLLSTASIFLFINSSADTALLITIYGITSILTGLAGHITAVKVFKIRYKFPGFERIIKEVKDGFTLFISSVSINLYTTSAVLILGFFAGETAVGYFSAADKVRTAVQGFGSAVGTVIYPRTAQVFSRNIGEGLRFIKKTVSAAGTLILCFSIVLYLLAEEIIYLAAGSAYASSVTLLQILALVPFVVFLSNTVGIQIMLNTGFKKEFSFIIIMGAVLSITLSLILIPLYAAAGTAVVMLVTEIFVTLSMILYLYRKMKLVAADEKI